MCRLSPFEHRVLGELAGVQHDLSDRVWRVRDADEIGQDCGLPASRVSEIAERAVARMKAMQTLAAD